MYVHPRLRLKCHTFPLPFKAHMHPCCPVSQARYTHLPSCSTTPHGGLPRFHLPRPNVPPSPKRTHLQGRALHVLDASSSEVHAKSVAAGEAEAAGPVVNRRSSGHLCVRPCNGGRSVQWGAAGDVGQRRRQVTEEGGQRRCAVLVGAAQGRRPWPPGTGQTMAPAASGQVAESLYAGGCPALASGARGVHAPPVSHPCAWHTRTAAAMSSRASHPTAVAPRRGCAHMQSGLVAQGRGVRGPSCPTEDRVGRKWCP